MKVFRYAVSVSLALLLFNAAGVAQISTVTGRVVDPQGSIVVNALVSLKMGAQLDRTARTAEDGMFAFEQVPAGDYVIQVEAPGFAPWIETVSVSPSMAAVSVSLQVASISETVEVLATAGAALTTPAATGSRLNLTPFEVPASLQIVTGEQVRERGDSTIEDAEQRIVGITSQAAPGNGGGSRMARGFGGVSSIMRLYDGRQLFIGSGTVSFPFDPWTVDRIEVLGGPASVMYGNGAIGGVINVIPRRPNRSGFEHSARLTGGSNNTFRAAVDTSGPINSRMAYRLDLSHIQTDGFVDRGESRSNALSASLGIEVTPDLYVTLSEDWGFQRPTKYFGTPLINGAFDSSLRRTNYNVLDANIYYKDNLSQVKADWRVAKNVTIRTGLNFLYTDRFWHDVETYSYIPASNLVQRTSYLEIWHDQQQYGNHTEAVISHSVFGLQNSASVGIDYDWVRFQHTNNSPNSNSSLVTLHDPSLGFFPLLPRSTPQFRVYSHHNSEFFEDRLVLNRAWSVVGGARFDTYNVDRRDLRVGGSASRTFHPLSWRGGLVYSPQRDFSLYGQYSTATDAVGTLLTLSPEQQLFDLTPGRQIEIGAKKSAWSGRVEFTVAGYRIVKKKLLIPDPDNPLRQQQVGAQSSRGVEITAGFIPVPGLRVDANAAFLHAKFDDFREVLNGVTISRTGNTPSNVPQQTANLWVSYNFLRDWQVQGGLRFVGSRYLNTSNTGTTPSYTVADLGARRRLTESVFLDLRLSNVFDNLYLMSVSGSNTAPPTRGRVGAPRTAEISLTARF